MVQLIFNIEKKDLFILAAITVFVVGAGIVIAYNPGGSGGNAAIMGHSVDEVDWSKPIPTSIGTVGRSANCPAGWGCGLHTFDVWAEANLRANQLCLGGSTTPGSADVGICRSSWPSSSTVIQPGPNTDGLNSVEITCPNGYYAISGGWKFISDRDSSKEPYRFVAVSYPSALNKWTINTPEFIASTYVVCMKNN